MYAVVKLRKLTLVFSSLVALVMSAAVSAGEGDFSIGAKVGWLNVELPSGAGDLDSSILAGVVAKYAITDAISIQGELMPVMLSNGAWSVEGFEFGEFDDASTLGVYVVAEAPVQPNFRLHGKVGIAKASGTVKVTDDLVAAVLEADGFPTEFEADGTGISFGFGATFDMGNGGALVAEYTLLPTIEDDYNGEYDVSMFSVGFLFKVK